MTEQTMATKQVYQAYLRGEVSFETVEQSASETLEKSRGTRGTRETSKDAKSS